MGSITAGQAGERCFICNCWERAATDPTMITDPSAGDPKGIYKVISFKLVVPSPNSPSTHRDAEPSHIPGQESTWDRLGGTQGENHSKPQPWRGVLRGRESKWPGCLLWRPGGRAGQTPQHLSSGPGSFLKYNYTLP